MSTDPLTADQLPPPSHLASAGADPSVNTEEMVRRLSSLSVAIVRGASSKRLLRLWSTYIRTRDGRRCVNCHSTEGVNAHHIVRKVLYPWGAFELGNGISLCRVCHRKVHATFNRRPDLVAPLGAEHGDDQDEWAFLFGILLDDAVDRGLDPDEFYFIGDHMLRFFVKAQGYADLYAAVERGELSRLRFAHEVWRSAPEEFYVKLGSDLLSEFLGDSRDASLMAHVSDDATGQSARKARSRTPSSALDED